MKLLSRIIEHGDENLCGFLRCLVMLPAIIAVAVTLRFINLFVKKEQRKEV